MDFAIVDARMPPLSVGQTIAGLREHRRMPVAVISGAARGDELPADVAYLAKPFDLAQLATLLDQLLEVPAEPPPGISSEIGLDEPPLPGNVTLSSILDSISDGVVFLDREWRFTYLNRRAEEIVGASSDALRGRTLWDAFPEAEGSEFAIGYRAALNQNRTVTVRDYYPPFDAWIEARAYPTENALVLSLRDVTESETVRRELIARNSEVAAQGALLDIARDAIVVRGLDGKIRYWNAAATRIYGWELDEVIGCSSRELIYPDVAQFDQALAATLRDGHWDGEVTQVTKSGSPIIADASWRLVRDEAGQPESVFLVFTDITEKRRQDELHQRTQRMESLGSLASGIAHDLNNVLTPILMAVQLLAPGESDPARQEILRSTELAVKRGAEMIRQVLSFASGAPGRRELVEVVDVLAELQSLCSELLPERVRVRFEVADELWATSGDPTQLLQVLMNLLTNARDSMPEGGDIVVRARNVTVSTDDSAVDHTVAPGSYVQLEIEDSGIGMPDEILNRIFEPFFTTKESSAGTGLGLSTSAIIVRAHDGYIQASSEPGRGSVFRVHLPDAPRCSQLEEGTIADLLDELPHGDGELVLIVDDEAAIRVLTRQTLEAYGYTTAVASNGAEAIAFIESGRSGAAVVLTDVSMPVMDGAATAAYLHREHPDLPVIVTSGLETDAGFAGDEHSRRLFLAKPYSTPELLRAISLALHPAREDNTAERLG
ncbi:MAG TPA: PAS domain-containing protein [Pseudolysinimonas sp.]|nr:PAS domain-containing protein [Pseudolysinimonas sp.]